MKRIGISQRVDYYPYRNEVRDALDQCWAPLLWSLGLLAIPLSSRNPDHADYLSALDLDGFILSGGNNIGEALDRDALEASVLIEASRKNLPVLGVCRGMQFINVFCDGNLVTVDKHVVTSHAITGLLADRYDLRTVNSFHDFGIAEQGLGVGLKAIAHSADNLVEAFHHEKELWMGIMWHPERNHPYKEADMKIIANHFGIEK